MRRLVLLLCGGWTVALALLLIVPLLIVVHAALAPSAALSVTSEQWVAGAGAGRAFRAVLSTYGAHLQNSLLLAVAVMVLVLAIGIPCGVAVGATSGAGLPGRAARAIEVLIALPLGLPGLVVALGLLGTYPGRGGEVGLLLVGHLLYTLPYAVRTIAETTRATALPALLQASRTLGAGPLRRFWLVGWPTLRRAIAAAALMGLVLSLGEFNVTFLLATPARGTFPTALYLTYTNNSFPVAAAATAIFLGTLLPLVVLAVRLGRGGSERPVQGA